MFKPLVEKKPLKLRFPEGQPRPRPRVVVHKADSGLRYPVFKYPQEIIQINSEAELHRAMSEYGHPMPMIEGAQFLKTVHAMRHLIEWIYPALRWYCKVYGVEIPEWLKGKGWAEGMSKEDVVRFFGPHPLKVGEWHEDPSHAGKRE